ncbi:MAG TPA: hypothetical protein VF216_02480 [Mizugakiibacter sp.]
MTTRHATIWLTLACCCVLAAAASAREEVTPPVQPQIFAPGVISGPSDEGAAAFTPDGDTVVFARGVDQGSALFVAHRVGGAWSTPRVAPFSGRWRDLDPAMAPDGSFLLFVSSRPAAAGGAPLDAIGPDGKRYAGRGMNLWRVDRRGDGWGAPVRLPEAINTSAMTFAPSVAGDGSVYFDARDPVDGVIRLYRAQCRDGRYLPPVRVALGETGAKIRDAAVAPDESFIVFSIVPAGSRAPLRLAIAFRERAGWSAPIDLGDRVNDAGYAMGSQLGADRRSVYFYSARRDAHAPDAAWNNGSDNLWSVSLAPWLDAHRAAASP